MSFFLKRGRLEETSTQGGCHVETVGDLQVKGWSEEHQCPPARREARDTFALTASDGSNLPTP